ncbi:MAG: IS1595 family transposase [Dermatophilaceae bacterium]|nr:IS1595 family transposase [Dermatophilaceae bacterium]
MRGVDYPATYQQLLAWFPDNDACLDYLARLRWPEGFVCPGCGHGEFWRTSQGLWMCRECERRTSVTAGTIFHRTRTPLSTWFAAIWFLTSQKNGMSALGLQRVLGFGSYETAWAWMHKLRRAMVPPERDRLSGIVELDETMVGGVSPGAGGGYGDKMPVMIAVERNGIRRLGRVRLAVAQRPGTTELVDWATQVIEPGSTIRTDGAQHLRRLGTLGYTHEYTTGYNAADKTSVLPGVHLVASLLKRWLIGTLHYRVEVHQLPYYLDEYTFRFNRRSATSRGLLFYRLLEQAIATDPHPLAQLHKPGETPISDFT